MRRTLKQIRQAGYLSSLFVISSLALPALAQNQTLPLGEVIRQDGSTVRGDREKLRQDRKKFEQAQSESDEYVQKTQEWMQGNDQQIQANQDKLRALESGKSRNTVARLLSTPGSELYIVNTLLQRELQNKEQAEANLSIIQSSLQRKRAAVEQDRYQITSDGALLNHDQGTYRDEMDRYYDLKMQKRNARYAGNPMARHYLTGFNQAAYDAGRHPTGLGNPYWGLRGNAAGYQGR